MRLRRMQHSGTHCVAFFGTRGRQGIRHPRSIYDRSPLIGEMWEEPDTDPPPGAVSYYATESVDLLLIAYCHLVNNFYLVSIHKSKRFLKCLFIANGKCEIAPEIETPFTRIDN
jgi:hypothetical protein